MVLHISDLELIIQQIKLDLIPWNLMESHIKSYLFSFNKCFNQHEDK